MASRGLLALPHVRRRLYVDGCAQSSESRAVFAMVHGVELPRHGYFGNVVIAHYDIGYMAECCLVLSLFGLYLVREAGRRIEF